MNQQEMVTPWNTAWGASAVSSGHDPTEKGLAPLNTLGSPQPLCQAQVAASAHGPVLPGRDVLSGLTAGALLTPSCLVSGMRKGQAPAWEEGTGGLQLPQASKCHLVR